MKQKIENVPLYEKGIERLMPLMHVTLQVNFGCLQLARVS
jgi:hypothetical protein